MEPRTSNEPFWRAGTEVFLEYASILVFLHAYLSLNRWNRNFSTHHLWGGYLALVILMGVAIFQPSPLRPALARFLLCTMSFILGTALLVIYLTACRNLTGQIMLVPNMDTAWGSG